MLFYFKYLYYNVNVQTYYNVHVFYVIVKFYNEADMKKYMVECFM